jgi:hypothetical protein
MSAAEQTHNKTNEISTCTYKYDMSRHKYRSVTFKKERREKIEKGLLADQETTKSYRKE